MLRAFCLLCWLCLLRQDSSSALTITDDLGRSLTLDKPARRVVVLGDFCAELVSALGADSLVVGRARWVNWPPQVAELPHLGLQTQPNLEVLIGWQPDLILADAHLRQALPLLEKLKLPVMIFQGRELAALKHAVKSLGQALARPARGRALLSFIDEICALLEQRLAKASPILLSFSQHGPPYYDILNARPLLKLARLRNVVPGQGSVNPEWLLLNPPPLAVLALWRPGENEENLAHSWQALHARPELKNIERFYVMDSRLIYNLQAMVGLLYLAKLSHPPAMAGVDPYAYHCRLWEEFFNLKAPAPMVFPHD